LDDNLDRGIYHKINSIMLNCMLFLAGSSGRTDE